jgi:hypothetical protein
LSRAAPGLALALACSVLASLPAVGRTLPYSGALTLLALAGAASLVVVPVGLWIRRARAQGWPRPDRALLLGTALSSLPLALFGGVLKSTTHHRPLGGATFAVATLCLLAICFGLAFRLSAGAPSAAPKSPWQSLFTVACLLSLAGSLALGTAAAARTALLDFVALALASGAAAFVKVPAWLERIHVALLLGLWAALVLGATFCIQSPELARSLTTRAPVSFAPLSWLGGGS